jgi:hypothetical protein
LSVSTCVLTLSLLLVGRISSVFHALLPPNTCGVNAPVDAPAFGCDCWTTPFASGCPGGTAGTSRLLNPASIAAAAFHVVLFLSCTDEDT